MGLIGGFNVYSDITGCLCVAEGDTSMRGHLEPTLLYCTVLYVLDSEIYKRDFCSPGSDHKKEKRNSLVNETDCS